MTGRGEGVARAAVVAGVVCIDGASNSVHSQYSGGERKRPTFHLQGRQRSVFNQANIGTVSRATLGRLLRDGAERGWAFPSAAMPS